jgi:hypothetical protein
MRDDRIIRDARLREARAALDYALAYEAEAEAVLQVARERVAAANGRLAELSRASA